MKESEAKTKVCPIHKSFCDGSICMMWIWQIEFYTEDIGDGVMAAGNKESETEGYCGLAQRRQ